MSICINVLIKVTNGKWQNCEMEYDEFQLMSNLMSNSIAQHIKCQMPNAKIKYS